MRKARTVLAGLAVALTVGAVAWWLQRPAAAPEAVFTTLAGETLSTTQLRGKVVLVEFWATTCGVCIKSMPRMADTYRRFAPQGFEMVAVAMRHDPQPAVAAFTRKRALPFKVVHDGSGQLAKQFGAVRLTPTMFLIDRDGRVLKRHVGEPDWAELHALVEKALRF
jgi:peroxiredoxin